MKGRRFLIIFLSLALFIILFQVMIGGITRLTGSGLSMTEWKVVLGTIPPTNPEAWQEAFEKYKAIPQYEKVNPLMTISEFKWIYFWEYLHRMWGRWGFLFLLGGFAIALFQKYLNRKWIIRFILLLLLYIAQGLMGWIMVKSGLSENIYVSHYRLAAHLVLALSIFAYIAWLLADLFPLRQMRKTWHLPITSGYILLFLLVLQVVFGAFMAGLRAAIHYPSWPDMNGALIPETLFSKQPFWLNFFENIATIQFTHRMLAYLLTGLMIWFYFRLRGLKVGRFFEINLKLMPVLLIVQVLLGILTLVMSKGGVIPISWGVFHQANGFLLCTNFFIIVFLLGKLHKGVEIGQ